MDDPYSRLQQQMQQAMDNITGKTQRDMAKRLSDMMLINTGDISGHLNKIFSNVAVAAEERERALLSLLSIGSPAVPPLLQVSRDFFKQWTSDLDITKSLTESVLGLYRNQYDSILDSVRRLHESLVANAIRNGLDSPDIHTETFLTIITPYLDSLDDDGQDQLRSEQTLRRLTGYDILLVVETELKSFVQSILEYPTNTNWWLELPNCVTGPVPGHKKRRARLSDTAFEDIDFLGLAELKQVFDDEPLWNSRFASSLATTQEEFSDLLLLLREHRNDIGHPRNMSDEDFMDFYYRSREILRLIRGQPLVTIEDDDASATTSST